MYNIVMDSDWLWLIMVSIWLFAVGACAGSFVGVLVSRLAQWRGDGERTQLELLAKSPFELLAGRSHCDVCGHQLAWFDLIPIISWLGLGGRCRYCRAPIGWQPLLLEVAGGSLFVLSWWLLPYGLGLITWSNYGAVELSRLYGQISLAVTLSVWLLAVSLMLALLVYDAKYLLLPNQLVWPLVLMAVVYAVASTWTKTDISIVGSGWLTSWLGWSGDNIAQWVMAGRYGAAVGNWLLSRGLALLPIAGVYGVLYLLSRGQWVGLGDVKLGLAIGFMTSWWQGVLVLGLANVLSLLILLPRLCQHDLSLQSKMPLGPFLIAATLVVVLLTA